MENAHAVYGYGTLLILICGTNFRLMYALQLAGAQFAYWRVGM